jgi:hypothetical protein
LTPHYDGVIRNHNEAVVIAICGTGPVNITPTILRSRRGGRCECTQRAAADSLIS